MDAARISWECRATNQHERGRAAVVLAAAALAPSAALAHGRELDWHVPASDSLRVLLPLMAATALYLAGLLRRVAATGLLSPGESGRAASFSLAIVLLMGALVWPLDAWAGLSFAAHMGQHMVLVALAPPLLLLGRPGPVWLRGLAPAWRAVATRPRRWPGTGLLRWLACSASLAAALHGALLWAWHFPAAFELALRDEWLHWIEHVTLLGSALLFWRALLRSRGAALGRGLICLLATLIHSGMLGALLTLAPRPLYGAYAGTADPLADQQLAGLIMWVPMGTVYLLAALALAGRELRGRPAGA